MARFINSALETLRLRLERLISAATSFEDDAASGDLSEVAGSPFSLSGAGADVPQAVQASPDSNYVYVAAQTSGLVYGYSIDAGTGALAELASSPFGPFDGAGSLASARLAGADFLFLLAREEGATPVYSFSIGPDGSLTQLSALGAGSGPVELAFDRQGSVLYVVNNLSEDISAYAAATDGTLSELANSPYDVPSGSNGPRTLHVANLPSGERFLYLAFDDQDLAQYEIESNGDLTQLLPPSLATGAAAVDLSYLLQRPPGEGKSGSRP